MQCSQKPDILQGWQLKHSRLIQFKQVVFYGIALAWIRESTSWAAFNNDEARFRYTR
ncbi:MAG: hypothetical protein GWP06_12050 [Actinobacteria bacterium]|nr:hypothetical protein [Actinomycetota bacterium]